MSEPQLRQVERLENHEPPFTGNWVRVRLLDIHEGEEFRMRDSDHDEWGYHTALDDAFITDRGVAGIVTDGPRFSERL